jgi:hypothetical protein
MVQNKYGLFDPTGTDGSPSVYRVSEFRGAGTPRFLHFETPNLEFSMAPRIGPMVLAPGHQEGGLGEGRLCFSFGHSGPEASSLIIKGRHGDVPDVDSTWAKSQYLLEINEEERGWLKTHITYLLQSMEIPSESLPGKVPCTGSLQEGHAESSTRHRNPHTPIQYSKGSTTPWCEPC